MAVGHRLRECACVRIIDFERLQIIIERRKSQTTNKIECARCDANSVVVHLCLYYLLGVHTHAHSHTFLFTNRIHYYLQYLSWINPMTPYIIHSSIEMYTLIITAFAFAFAFSISYTHTILSFAPNSIHLSVGNLLLVGRERMNAKPFNSISRRI